MKFTKMQGLGNDYLYVFAAALPPHVKALSKRLSDRHFGAGADGMIYAVLIMNLFAQRLDVLTKPSRYGKGGIRRESQKIPE